MNKLNFSTVTVVSKVLSCYKILGFYAITIVNRKSVTKPIDLFFLLLSISTGVSICFFSVSLRSDLASSSSEIANTGSFFVFISAIIVAIISMICAFVFRHKAWTIVLKSEEIELKVCEVWYEQ
jgi:hypothetical protein